MEITVIEGNEKVKRDSSILDWYGAFGNANEVEHPEDAMKPSKVHIGLMSHIMEYVLLVFQDALPWCWCVIDARWTPLEHDTPLSS